jgi:hypothetical protein
LVLTVALVLPAPETVQVTAPPPAEIVNVNDEPQFATVDVESVTLTWMPGKLPETEGVPLMMPVDEPLGNEPVSEKVYAGVPPETDGVAPV